MPDGILTLHLTFSSILLTLIYTAHYGVLLLQLLFIFMIV